jgi:uncharacterized protein YaiE (UPF0345 family)
MKTYQSPGISKSVAISLKKVFLPLFIIIISLPAFSQELAIVKSSYQHIQSVTSWSETVKNSDGGAANWINLSKNNSYTQKIATERNMEVVEGSLKVCLDNRRAVINWTSYQDINTNFYVIERSVNGQPFKEIAQIFTSPDSTAKFDYQYFDKLATDIRGTIYYRLKITDANDLPVVTAAQLASSNKSYENLLVSLKN